MVAVVVFAVVATAVLLWSKWWPYAGKAHTALVKHTWSAPSVLDTAGRAGDGPSLQGGWDFTVAYGKSVWKAWVAGLILAAAASALIRRDWLLRALGRGRGPGGGAAAGGIAGMVTLMCTACAAPVTASLRRDGVRSSATLGFLYANPVLNPAVLIILAAVAPWQWVATRIVLGLVLVFVLAAVVERLSGERPTPAPEVVEVEPARAAESFLRRLVLLAVTLTPLYVVLTLLEGTFRGWILPLDGSTTIEVAVLVAIVLGTIVDVPTTGEVPIVLSLAAAGMGAPVVGALLLTLPAISFGTMVLIRTAHGIRTTALAGVAVAVTGIGGALLLPLLGG